MAGYTDVAASQDVIEGEAAAFAIGDLEVAVARVDGALHAFSDICSHRRCNLSSGGEIVGTTIVCECHGSAFSIVTGAVENPPATEPIAVYPVRETEAGRIEIEA